MQHLEEASSPAAGPAAAGSRAVLAIASAGGHFKQLVSLVDRIPDVGRVTWLTHDNGMSRELLEAVGRGRDRLVLTNYAAPRDLANLARNARSASRVLREEHFDLAISTGAGIAVATLPLARGAGIRTVFVESATRAEGPSLSGRMLRWTPGVEVYSQHPGYAVPWQVIGSVHDRFRPGPRRAPRLGRAVVTTGTIRPYGFRRLLERLVAVLPPDTDVLWQVGETDVSGLPIDGRTRVPAAELEAAMRAADLVIAHAGTGTAVTAFELGVAPVLVPRRHRHDEHVDDHQVVTAVDLAGRGLATHLEVEELDRDTLLQASTRSVEVVDDLSPVDL